MKKILCVDPGIGKCGYAILKGTKAIDYGVIDTPKEYSVYGRLHLLQRCIKSLILNNPVIQELIIEIPFFTGFNTNAAIVQYAVGVILVAAEECKLPIFEYKATEVKNSVTGNGKANKTAMKKAVKQYYELPNTKGDDDAFDALAIGICHNNKTLENN